MELKNEGRRMLNVLITAIALSFAWVGGAAAAVVDFALPDGLSPNDDGSSAAVPIGFPINFFGVTHTQLFVNNNGNVTLGAPLSAFTPFGLAGTRQAIIAPFFADVDTRGAGSGIVRFGTPAGRPDLFVVTWIQVGYFNQHDDKLNRFQLILQDLSAVADRVPGDFLIVFNYDRILWETGDASGGTNGLGGSSARVGFSNGSGQPGTFFELRGSGTNGALLDGGRFSLVGLMSPLDPSIPPGRYEFQVRNGAVARADLAIAADIDDDDDFELVVRNFGPSDATGVEVDFQATGGGEFFGARPSPACEVDEVPGLPSSSVTCRFPLIPEGASRRIRILADDVSSARALVASAVFDSDLSNNVARAVGANCRGQILSRSAPESVLYELNVKQTLRLAIINTGDVPIAIRRIRKLIGQPFSIEQVQPRLPRTIEPGDGKVFRVRTVGNTTATAQRPYFRISLRCLD